MLKITKQNIEKTELLSKTYHYEKDIKFHTKTYHYEKDIKFHILNNKIVDNLIIHILFDKDFDKKYYIKMIRADKLFNISINDIGEFENFYEVLETELFNALCNLYHNTWDEIADIKDEIMEKIQEVIEDEKINFYFPGE